MPRLCIPPPSMDIYEEFSRCELLEQAIQTEFGQSAEDNCLLCEAESYDESITEMFEVVRVKDESIIFAHLFNGDRYESVYLPEGIRRHLRPDDTFLVTMARDGDKWIVLWMSRAYETLDWNEDEEETVYH